MKRILTVLMAAVFMLLTVVPAAGQEIESETETELIYFDAYGIDENAVYRKYAADFNGKNVNLVMDEDDLEYLPLLRQFTFQSLKLEIRFEDMVSYGRMPFCRNLLLPEQLTEVTVTCAGEPKIYHYDPVNNFLVSLWVCCPDALLNGRSTSDWMADARKQDSYNLIPMYEVNIKLSYIFELVQSGALEVLKGDPVYAGKILFVIKDDMDVSSQECLANGEAFYSVPSSWLAENYDEADTAVFIFPVSSLIGRYSNGGEARSMYTRVCVVNLRTLCMYEIFTAAANDPPETIPVNTDNGVYSTDGAEGEYEPQTAVNLILTEGNVQADAGSDTASDETLSALLPWEASRIAAEAAARAEAVQQETSSAAAETVVQQEASSAATETVVQQETTSAAAEAAVQQETSRTAETGSQQANTFTQEAKTGQAASSGWTTADGKTTQTGTEPETGEPEGAVSSEDQTTQAGQTAAQSETGEPEGDVSSEDQKEQIKTGTEQTTTAQAGQTTTGQTEQTTTAQAGQTTTGQTDQTTTGQTGQTTTTAQGTTAQTTQAGQTAAAQAEQPTTAAAPPSINGNTVYPWLTDELLDEILDALGDEEYRETLEALANSKDLVYGSRGDVVLGVQKTIVAFGREITQDSSVGNLTLGALNEIQAALELQKTNKINYEVYALLMPGLLISTNEEAASQLLKDLLSTEEDSEYDYLRAGTLYLKDLYYSAKSAYEISHFADYKEQAENCVQDMPDTGQTYKNSGLTGNEASLTVQVNSYEESAVTCVKVYSDQNELASCLIIRGTGSATAVLPAGNYRVVQGTGYRWYGIYEMFGEDGSYETMIFDDGSEYLTMQTGYDYTLTFNVLEHNEAAHNVGSDSADWMDVTD